MAVSLPLCEWLKAEGARFDTVDSFGVGSLLMAIEGEYADEDDDDEDEDEDDEDEDEDDDDDEEEDDDDDVDENAQNGIRNEVAELPNVDEDELPNMDDEAIEARRLRREALAEAREARRAAHARRLERRTALEESKLALCRWLLAEGVRVNGQEGGVNGQDGESARQQESNGSVDGPRAVSRSGPDDGLTPLHMACGMGFVRMAQVRCAQGIWGHLMACEARRWHVMTSDCI